MSELKRKIKLKEENIERQEDWLKLNDLDLMVLQKEAEELVNMKKEYFENGGKYGRVYIYPEKITIRTVDLPSK